METTNPNENLVSKKPTPWLIEVVHLVRVQEWWLLIARDCHFAVGKLFLYSLFRKSARSQLHILVVGRTHSGSFQSTPAGQSSDPIALWWNPWVVLTLWARGGFSATSRGVTQSNTAPFILFMSSDLALETPFWICNRRNEQVIFSCHRLRHTISAIAIDSLFEHSMRRSSRCGTISNNFWNTRYSLLHLYHKAKVTTIR